MSKHDIESVSILDKRRAKAIYEDAVTALLQNAQTEEDFEKAAAAFKGISEYKNAAELADKCLCGAEYIRKEKAVYRQQIKRETERRHLKRQKEKRHKKRLRYSLFIIAGFITACVILVQTLLLPKINYNNAEKFFKQGDFSKAAISFGKAKNYKDARERSFELWDKIAARDTVSCINGYWGAAVVGLKTDGQLIAAGDDDLIKFIEPIQDIIAVSTGYGHIVGLKSDGSAVARGYTMGDYRCDLHNWKDIVAISAKHNTIGLKSDGTVVVAGDNDAGKGNVSGWRDIVAISAGDSHTVGLKSDGTVVATGSDYYNACDVSDWQDIVAISAGGNHTTGLKADGTVVAVGKNENGQCNVSEWRNIVAVAAANTYTIGLKSDGTVITTDVINKIDDYGQHNVSHWRNIVAISTGEKFTVGIRSNGAVVITDIFSSAGMYIDKNKGYDKLNEATGWSDIKIR